MTKHNENLILLLYKMNPEYITIDDIENMGIGRLREQERQTERRRDERMERKNRQQMDQMRDAHISLLEEQLKLNEAIKEEKKRIKVEKKRAKEQYRLMVENDPLLSLEEMLRELSENVSILDRTIPWYQPPEYTFKFHRLPKNPPETFDGVQARVVNETLEDLVSDVEALDYYDNAMGQ
jgi:hypothetical protein